MPKRGLEARFAFGRHLPSPQNLGSAPVLAKLRSSVRNKSVLFSSFAAPPVPFSLALPYVLGTLQLVVRTIWVLAVCK